MNPQLYTKENTKSKSHETGGQKRQNIHLSVSLTTLISIDTCVATLYIWLASRLRRYKLPIVWRYVYSVHGPDAQTANQVDIIM